MDLLTQAKTYQEERGWNVIPLAREAKVPLAGFPLAEFFERRMTEPELCEWFGKEEAGNIGVVVGPTSGFWVADIDDLDKVDEFRSKYPSDLMSRTPSGGLHLFYEYPQGVEIPNGHIGSGIDILSREHYVLVAPSYVKNGRHSDRVYSGSYEWLKYGQPSVAPRDVMVAALTGQEGTISGEHGAVRMVNVSRAEAMNLLGYAMRHGKFFEGRHNETIYYGALVLAGDGMSQDLITEMMLGFDQRDPSPQGERAVRIAVSNACRIAQERRQEREQALGISPDAGYTISLAAPAMAAPAKKDFATKSYEEIAQEYEGYETKWIVDGWLLESSVIMLAAPPERYKTWWAIDLAVSVATGLPFLGQEPVLQTGDVLIVQQEDFGARLINRFNMIESSKARLLDEEGGFKVRQDGDDYYLSTEFNPNWNTIHFHTDASLKLDDPTSLQSFKAKVRELKPKLVIVDPFYSLSNKTDDYYASLADTIRQHIKELRNETGASFVFVHHTGKGNKDGDDPTQRQGAWGSQFINAVMEGMIMLSRQKGMGENSVSAYRRFKDAEVGAVVNLTFTIKDKDYSVEFGAADSLENDVKLFLLEQGPTSLADLFDEFGDRFGSKPQLTNWLKNCSDIVKEKRGIYALAPDVRLEV